ncbi:cytochrome c oxidase subunit II [Novosphingobium endophyticum]|uniref:Cytochrome c oxidase subunit II n=1 Tax=Novosphingobium endophyticum TaxID=1955250 RepID=A0A916TSW9_9SPHN|nr:c-type cytochrome [Novosphingobium endophyticum]GGC02289.1 cytochrome c oxidase subunit II [Novosphingobium endophyticum]
MLEPLWGWPPPVLDPAGPYAEKVTVLAWALFAMGLLVTGVVIVALWVAIKGPPWIKSKLGGEKVVWIGGVAFPAVVLTILLVWGLTLTASLTQGITGKETRIRVTGEMWWFRVQYLGPNGEVILNDANEIHLPVGEPVVLELRSADVIHSFWVPHLSGKKDMIPGRKLFLRVQADKAGRYGGVCAEYCGGPHALMGFVAVAHERAAWEGWLAERHAAQAAAPAGPAMPGRRIFLESGCGACHRVAGTEANGLIGPDLTHVGSRLTLGAGILPNNHGTLMGWIGDSQSIKPGNRMPSYSMLPAEKLDAIADWLGRQK